MPFPAWVSSSPKRSSAGRALGYQEMQHLVPRPVTPMGGEKEPPPRAARGKTSSSKESWRGGNRRDGEGKGKILRIRKTKQEKSARERKIKMLSEAITSKRFQKAQHWLIRDKFHPVEQAQGLCSSISSLTAERMPVGWQEPTASTGAWDMGRTSSWLLPHPGTEAATAPEPDKGTTRTDVGGCGWE